MANGSFQIIFWDSCIVRKIIIIFFYVWDTSERKESGNCRWWNICDEQVVGKII
jgi:hypothetical protein